MAKRVENLHKMNKSRNKIANNTTKGSAFKKSKASSNPYRPDPSGGKKGS